MTNKTLITNSFEETQRLGKDFVKQIKNGAVLALFGDLGSGKTTFVQGLAKGLGIKQKIISPTFIIVRNYKIPNNNETMKQLSNFYHIDLYRVENVKELDNLGLNEIINNKSNIVAIEWPEKIEKFLPKKRIDINFKYIKDDKRQIEINELQ